MAVFVAVEKRAAVAAAKADHLTKMIAREKQILESVKAAAEQAEHEAKLCAVCGRKAEERCGSCFCVVYCEIDCQKKHWATHKSICADMPAQKAAAAAAVAAKIEKAKTNKMAAEEAVSAKDDESAANPVLERYISLPILVRADPNSQIFPNSQVIQAQRAS